MQILYTLVIQQSIDDYNSPSTPHINVQWLVHTSSVDTVQAILNERQKKSRTGQGHWWVGSQTVEVHPLSQSMASNIFHQYYICNYKKRTWELCGKCKA